MSHPQQFSQMDTTSAKKKEEGMEVSVEEREDMHHPTDLNNDNKGASLSVPEDAARERRLKWKMDLTIMPLLALTYFLSSLGRSDLANANVAGLSKSLHLSPHQYANVASFFQIGYILLQLPGTVLVRQISPPYQFGGAMLLWGVFTLCNVYAKSYGTLLGLRVLVGMSEAFIQGAVFYLSFWYTYTELATRGAILFSTSALAGSFNGLLAYAIEKNLVGKHGWKAWQWLYFIEGILPIGCSILIMVLLPSTPERGHFLFTKEERELAVRRSRSANNPEEPKLRPRLIHKPLLEIRFWLLALCYACNHFVVGSLGNFLPAIIKGFGYSAVRSQLMSVIVYACALVGINAFAVLADRTNRRGLPLLGVCCIAIVGIIMLLTITDHKGRLAGTCILAFGAFATIPLNLVWLTVNMAGYTKRGSSSAMMNMIAQAFSIAGNQAFVDPPYYRTGLAASLGVMCVHVIAILAMLWAVKRSNSEKDKLVERSSEEELRRLRAESLDIVGDRHIDFRAGY